MTSALRHAIAVESLEPGPLLDETVCDLVGIAFAPLYCAVAPRGGSPWRCSELEGEIVRAIQEASHRPSDWRCGSDVVVVPEYPPVSAYPASGRQVIDALVARGVKVSLSSRAMGWLCFLILNAGQPNERQYTEHGDTPELAVCAAVLAAAEALRS